MELQIHEEIQDLLISMEEDMAKNKGQIYFSEMYFNFSFLNLTGSTVIGTRHSINDPKIKKLLQDSYDFISSGVFGTGLLVAFPFLRFLFPQALGYNTQMKAVKGIQGYAKVSSPVEDFPSVSCIK